MTKFKIYVTDNEIRAIRDSIDVFSNQIECGAEDEYTEYAINQIFTLTNIIKKYRNRYKLSKKQRERVRKEIDIKINQRKKQ